MKIISTFIIAHKWEVESLYIKLVNESECVDEWIPIESDTTVQGAVYKGFNLPAMLAEPRFAPFLDRIKPVLNTEPVFDTKWARCEASNFQAEFKSRSLCMPYLVQNCSDDDWIVLSDVDESMDFSCVKRRDLLWKIFRENNTGVEMPIQKYWYDCDVMYFGEKWLIAHPLRLLKSGPNSFAHKQRHCQRLSQYPPVGFEYSNFTTAENILHKYETSAHDNYDIESIYRGLNLACWHRCERRGEKFNTDIYDWFETVELTPENSPRYVRENLHELKTYTVNPLYADERQKIGFARSPIAEAGKLNGNIIKAVW